MDEYLQSLVEQKNNLNDVINDYKDGFKYLNKVAVYGSYFEQEYNNYYTMVEDANEFNGDNGLVELFTTNPNIPNSLTHHNIFVIDNKEFDKIKKLKFGEYEK